MNDYLAELLRLQIEQLEIRLAEQNESLARRIAEIQAAQENLAAAVLARIDAHEEYHRQNEHRWGLIKLAARHPFRFAAIAVSLFAALNLFDSAPQLADFLNRLSRLFP